MNRWVMAIAFCIVVPFMALAQVPAQGVIGGTSPASGGGSGGMSIGGTVTGGTATRLLYEGAGPVLADNDAFTVNDSSSLRQVLLTADPAASVSQAQFRVINNAASTSTVTSDFVALNYNSDYIVGRMYGATSGTDEFGLSLARQGRWQCSTNSDCVVVAQGGSLQLGNANRAGTTGTLGITINGSGVQLPSYNLEQIGGTATHFTKGHCTLNGASPSSCTGTVAGSTMGGTIECTCSINGTTAAAATAGCAVNRSGTTLTVTSSNGHTEVVTYICW